MRNFSKFFEGLLNRLISDRKYYLKKQEDLEKFRKNTIERIADEIDDKKYQIEKIKMIIKVSTRKDDIRPLLAIARETLKKIDSLTTDLENANDQYDKMSK